MDHQQNFEYSDPNFGFINSFSGSDNFMIPPDQQQQLNGKTHEDGLQQLTSFGSEHQATLYSSEPAPMFHLPDTMASPPIHYPDNNVNFHHQTTPPEAINVQKDPNFASVEPVLAVPVNIIHDQPEPTTVEPMEVDPEKEIVSSTAIEENPHIEVVQESENEKAQEVLVESQEVLVDSPAIPTSSPKPAVISPEQNNMMKALGVMRKEYFSPSGTSKKRRRILQLNDSDDECDLKKELQISPEKKVEEEVESEESETDADPEAIKARSLLKSAVIIHGPASRKKKRVLESDEEDEMLTSVDDIGLIETNENENDEEMFNSDIIVDIGYDTTEKVVPIENPIIVQDDFVEPKPPGEKEKVDEDGNNLDENKLEESVKDEEKKTVKTEDCEIDPAMSVEAILDNIKPMADDDEFFKTFEKKSEESDFEVAPNDEYFGSPDMLKKQSGKKRGPKPGARRDPRENTGRRKRANKYAKDNFVEDSSESEDTSYSESSSSSDSSCEEVRPRGRPPQKPPVIVKPKTFTVARVPIKRKVSKKGRFYDKSRDIPNDVYFGDVNVPLHVLHTRWASDVESSGSEEPQQIVCAKVINPRFSSYASSSKVNFITKVKPPSTPSYTFIEQNDDPKLSNLKEFTRIAGIKINYSKLFENIRSSDDKCTLIRRILAQKGLPGEPTIAKCKQLRLDLQAKRESAELDKSVIIRAEGRTRRAMQTRNSSQPSTSGAVIQPETLQTLSKIRRVVDSDSE